VDGHIHIAVQPGTCLSADKEAGPGQTTQQCAQERNHRGLAEDMRNLQAREAVTRRMRFRECA